jgi:regulator of nucleoside diphosphate kinase
MVVLPGIIVTAQDHARLQALLACEGPPALDHLDAELARAQVVPAEQIASDVVTMNSEVSYLDLASGVERTVRVVYPPDANAALGRVSVLAPLGQALLGLRVGQEITWTMPGGPRRLRVIAVPYQPEASGDRAL